MNTPQDKIICLIKKIEGLIPFYIKKDEDETISNGNVAVCIIDEVGEVFGKVFVNNDRIRARESFRVAWIKASQVWITRMKTGKYEKKIYNGELSEWTFRIRKPELIGWEGGQPIVLKDGSKLSVGFSGFRGESDLEIVLKAVRQIETAE